MTREEAIERVKEIINNMSESDMIYIHNEYCEARNYYDDRIEYYDSIDELCYGMKPTEIIEKFGDLYNSNSEYIKFTIYGAESADWTDVMVDDIAEYCIDSEESFYNDDIQEVIDEYLESLYEDEDEEEEDEED